MCNRLVCVYVLDNIHIHDLLDESDDKIVHKVYMYIQHTLQLINLSLDVVQMLINILLLALACIFQCMCIF